MAGFITKLGVGVLLMGLLMSTGFLFLVSTANLNGITVDDLNNLNTYENKSAQTRAVVYNSSEIFSGSDFDTERTDTAQIADSFKTTQEQLNFWTIIKSFYYEFTALIPISSLFLSVLGGLVSFLLLMASLYFFWGRTP